MYDDMTVLADERVDDELLLDATGDDILLDAREHLRFSMKKALWNEINRICDYRARMLVKRIVKNDGSFGLHVLDDMVNDPKIMRLVEAHNAL